MKKILIVDEERWYMEGILDRIDADFGQGRYDYCFNGQEAIDKLKTTQYAVIVLDLMLPLGEGLQLPTDEPDLLYGIFILRKIREIKPNVPAICYTIINDAKVKEQLRKLNAQYIGKLEDNSFTILISELKKYINT